MKLWFHFLNCYQCQIYKMYVDDQVPIYDLNNHRQNCWDTHVNFSVVFTKGKDFEPLPPLINVIYSHVLFTVWKFLKKIKQYWLRGRIQGVPFSRLLFPKMRETYVESSVFLNRFCLLFPHFLHRRAFLLQGTWLAS